MVLEVLDLVAPLASDANEEPPLLIFDASAYSKEMAKKIIEHCRQTWCYFYRSVIYPLERDELRLKETKQFRR